MRYKLIEGSLNDIYNPQKTILTNRGITDIKTYLNLDDSVLNHFSTLDNMDKAVECMLKHIDNNSSIHIICDSDADGYCSAAMLYNYLKLINQNINLSYSIHTKKQHGISDDIQLPEDINLLICPDSATNDTEECKKLFDKGVDIIILDHHQQDKENPYAIIVNNQTCDYPNKSLSGAGIVYKFLQAFDDETWNSYADNFIDLVALSNIGDVMDIRSYETKRLIDKGLSHIRNKFFKALIEKQSYSIGNSFNIISVQFYIVPLINALVRSGDYDEKEMMFRAFIETDEVFKYKPRKKSKDDPEPEEVDENIYDRVARLCANAKNRQNNSKDKSLVNIYEHIEKKGYDNNKIMIANVTGLLDESLTGVTAIKVAEKYNKPCLLLRKSKDDENVYAGSGRNINDSPIVDLKAFLEETGLFDFVTGHPGAFGAGIKKENIPVAIQLINEKLKDVDFTHCYDVDFIVEAEDLSISFIRDIDGLKDVYGQGIKESLLVIKNVEVCINNIQVYEKTTTTLKFVYNDEITFIKFKCQEDEEIIKIKNDEDRSGEILTLNIIGKASINNYNGILSPQIIIEKYEIIGE
jgi:single-stranded-DNA-specific exonuclease